MFAIPLSAVGGAALSELSERRNIGLETLDLFKARPPL